MKIKLVKHQLLENDPWWFELGITVQTREWDKHKYLFTLGFGFHSVYISWRKQQ
jgi:hypothetical protein